MGFHSQVAAGKYGGAVVVDAADVATVVVVPVDAGFDTVTVRVDVPVLAIGFELTALEDCTALWAAAGAGASAGKVAEGTRRCAVAERALDDDDAAACGLAGAVVRPEAWPLAADFAVDESGAPVSADAVPAVPSASAAPTVSAAAEVPRNVHKAVRVHICRGAAASFSSIPVP